MRYYFALLSLPELSFDCKPEISFEELKDFFVLNLSTKDIEKFFFLLRPIDLYNIKAFWLGMPLDDRGALEAKDLEEMLLVQDGFFPDLTNYLTLYETTLDRLRYFHSLLSSFFQEARLESNRFLREYFHFERKTLLVLTALRAKQIGRDLVKELQFEDVSDPFVAYLLAQKDSEELTVPQEFENLKILFVENSQDPKELNRAILQYRFEKIEEIEQSSSFSLEQVLGYAARFLIVDGVFRQSHENGDLAVEALRAYE